MYESKFIILSLFSQSSLKDVQSFKPSEAARKWAEANKIRLCASFIDPCIFRCYNNFVSWFFLSHGLYDFHLPAKGYGLKEMLLFYM